MPGSTTASGSSSTTCRSSRHGTAGRNYRLFDVPLEEGYHRISVEYFEKAFLATMVLEWTSNLNQPPIPIGPKSYFHSTTEPMFMAPKMPELLAVVTGKGQNVTSVAFEPAGKLVAVAGEDKKVRLLDPTTQKDVGAAAVHPMGVLCVAFSPDGTKFATGARDNKVRIWDLRNRTELKTFEGFTSYVQCVAFSPDGKQLAAGSFDRSVRIWAVELDEDPRVLGGTNSPHGHTAGVETLAFSQDSKKL